MIADPLTVPQVVVMVAAVFADEVGAAERVGGVVLTPIMEAGTAEMPSAFFPTTCTSYNVYAVRPLIV